VSLAETQAELARLFTQRAARAALPEPDPEIARYAAGLIAKRRLDVEKWLPLTAKALGPAFAPQLRAALGEPPPGAKADALALVERLQGQPEPPWIGDLAAYEAEFLRAWVPGAHFALRRYRWPVARIADRVSAGAALDDVRPAMTLAVWVRTPGGRLVHRWRTLGRNERSADATH
jgi:hypothetical protein